MESSRIILSNQILLRYVSHLTRPVVCRKHTQLSAIAKLLSRSRRETLSQVVRQNEWNTPWNGDIWSSIHDLSIVSINKRSIGNKESATIEHKYDDTTRQQKDEYDQAPSSSSCLKTHTHTHTHKERERERARERELDIKEEKRTFDALMTPLGILRLDDRDGGLAHLYRIEKAAVVHGVIDDPGFGRIIARHVRWHSRVALMTTCRTLSVCHNGRRTAYSRGLMSMNGGGGVAGEGESQAFAGLRTRRRYTHAISALAERMWPFRFPRISPVLFSTPRFPA